MTTTDRLCKDCVHSLTVPFAPRRCTRVYVTYPPSILDERLSGECGLHAKFFEPRRKVDAA